MRILLFILISIILNSCSLRHKDSKSTANENWKRQLFDTTFNDSDIKTIDFIEIEHPMLGGIVAQKQLSDDEVKRFILDISKIEKGEILKCGSKYVIRFNFEKDTLRLKVCGSKISNRYKDLYYKLPDDKDIIKEYWNKRTLNAYLIQKHNNDTISHYDTLVGDDSQIDLSFCLKNYHYPPKLPENIFWTKPDTTGYSIIEKENLKYKYNFNDQGKVTLYYYQGSFISGVFPLPYFFDYDKNEEHITRIIDGFYKTKYIVNYNKTYEITSIEKIDSLNNLIEKLELIIK